MADESKPDDDGNDGKNNKNTDTPATTTDTISIEQVFDLLKDGKGFQSKSDYWNAADRFVQAQDMLQSLAKENTRETTEDQEIASLYEQQAREYLFQSRQCLIEAMSQERAMDEDNIADKTLLKCQSLSDEEAELRNRTFAMLFSKPFEPKQDKIPENADEENIDEQQWSLEERLQELNASLPSDLKSSDERMNDINKGLNRLGLSLYPQKEPFSRFMKEELPKDEDEQIADVIAQAQDEVAVEQQFGEASKVLGKKAKTDDDEDDDDLTDSDDDDDEEKEGDELLEDEQLVMAVIRRKVVKAQTKLAQLVAYLDEAKIAKDQEDADEDLNDYDDDSIEKPDYTTYLISGKKKLRGARRDLKKALEEWAESL